MKRVGLLAHCSAARLSALVWAVSLVYCEWLSWYRASWHWSRVAPIESDSELVTILLAADPQLIGYSNEPILSGPFSRWDADRYLAKGFHLAAGFTQPDLVVFLGDLFDEGSTADSADFQDTLERFERIFDDNNTTVKLFISGDNDVGGEGVERVKEDKISRFQGTFSNGPLKSFVFHFLEFMQTDFYGSAYEEVQTGRKRNFATPTYRLLFSHFPLLPSYSKTVEMMLSRSNPDFIISAHDHKSYVSTQNEKGQLSIKHLRDSSVMTVLIDPESSGRSFSAKDISELTVPTCTYRMGVAHMGYSFAMIELLKNESLAVQLTVLWLPGRYPQLYFYCFLILLTSVQMAICRILTLRRYHFSWLLRRWW